MKILVAASEVVPFAKTGGLADVAGSLPLALRERGHDVRVIMPGYRGIHDAGIDIRDTGEKIHVRLGDHIITAGLFEGLLADRVPVYFVRYDPFFDREFLYGTPEGDYPDNASRFIFFSRAILDAMKSLDFWPQVLHLNDWQTALAALYLRTYQGVDQYSRVSSLFTIHNLGYQGLYWQYDFPLTGLGWEYFTPEGIEFYGKMNLLKGGLVFADRLNTVSRKYAQEIRTAEFGFGLEGVLESRSRHLSGILNGMDDEAWNPATDPLIPARYSAQSLAGKIICKKALCKSFGLNFSEKKPVIGCVSRLTSQKGFDLITEIADDLGAIDLSLVVLGDGDAAYRTALRRFADRYPGRFGLKIGYDNRLAHLIEAGSDFFLMPSRYEPCGLNQMYSLRYGTVPIVRDTGGLSDTVTRFNRSTGRGTGFKFTEYSGAALLKCVRQALRTYQDRAAMKRLMANGMACDHSWSRSAEAYEALYAALDRDNRGTASILERKPGNDGS
ncbi:MAG: glycogen synthase GlgA [bacterium]|nr:glycogen synthase GlgA [bacterium]